MSHRLLALLMALCLILSALPALGEETDATDETEPTAEELQELKQLDEVTDEDEEPTFVIGDTYQEKTLADFTLESPAVYTCSVQAKSSFYADKSTSAEKMGYVKDRVTADVLYVGIAWVIVRYEGAMGWIKRDRISSVTPVDSVNTPPYGVQKHTYIATTATECAVRKSMNDQDDSWVVLQPGTMLSIWQIQDGWAIVNYWRTYGYINMNCLTDLIPVSPTDTPLRDDTPIAAYTSYYNMSQDDTNKSRIVNIRVGCERLSRVLAPGESLNFNKDVGPYRKSLGYQPAWVLIDGTSVKGYGGGTCQVSSTLYNALLQLPKVEILQRRPHGPAGAKYLPHGVDAAVGNDNLNLRFRNNYDFSIRIEGHTSSDGALLMLVYKVDE